MQSNARLARRLSALAISATAALAPAGAAFAATLQWTGTGSSAFWSDAFNWSPQRPPADGDDLLFGGAPPRTASLFDLARTFSSMSFSANAAQFVTHVSGSGAQLAFSGAGIGSLAAVGSASVRQAFFADAGTGAGTNGGTILFTNSSGINVGSPQFARAVDLTALCGAAGAVGGHIVFQDASATSGTTFDALRAEGASAAAFTGATGGEIVFRDNALATKTSSVTVVGGTVAGALDGQAGFSGQARAAGKLGGLGGRIDFAGNAVAMETVNLSVQGADSAVTGAEGLVSFRGDARLLGGAFLGQGTAGGASGGRLEFFGRASHDSSGANPALGIVGISVAGSSVANAGGGVLVFHDDSFVLGTQLFISNTTSEGAATLSFGGSTSFLDRSRAGQATIQNAGTGAAGARGGTTNFRNQANAERATIVSQGGFGSGAAGGGTQFSDDASAGSATIVNAPGQLAGAGGGVTTFSGNAGAGSAFISNDTSFSSGGGGAGRTLFRNNASAQRASIDNQGSLDFPASQSNFYADASAGNARITNFGGKAAGVYGGFSIFFDRASASTASIVTAGGGVDRSLGGVVEFFGDSTAGNASFLVQGAQVNTIRGPEAASVTFDDVASAASARFDLLAGQDRGGSLRFNGSDALHRASAGSATIVNQGSTSGTVGLTLGGATNFQNNATAAAARITNEAGVAFGYTSFFGNSVAGTAVILNAGGRDGEFGGGTQFNSDASAGSASITARGAASSADVGGLIVFGDTSTAASAVLVAEGGSNGGSGGRIRFAGSASGGAARLLLSTGTGVGTSTGTGGELDISALTGSGTSTGSIEGGGSVSLGSKTLTVGSNGLGSTFSGVIADGGVVPGSGGSLTVIGAGRLTLTGANIYTGATHIGDGISANSGKLVVANLSGSATGSGAVFVERGGTLAGSGLIAGPVTSRAGGTIAPGDPVTLTLRSSLTWDGGGVIRLVLGADSAGSDHLDVGSLLRGSSGTSGSFMFDLVDAGIVAGASYDLLRIGSLVGFAPTDFTFSGAAGSFAFDSTGALAFTAAAVPEPASAALLALGLGVLGVSFGAARWRVSRPPARGAARPAPVPSHA